MTWERFDRAALHYEAWYETPRGRRASRIERRLLGGLLARFPHSPRVLEIGCGTAHFARWLAGEGASAVGLDRSRSMLGEARRLAPGLPLVWAEAQRLPFASGSVEVAVFVTTLEFLASPRDALAEAVRVARAGVIVVALNRWSVGGLSRRWGSQAQGELLGRARDLSLPELRALLRRAAGRRLRSLHWASGMFPAPFRRVVAPIPLGEVLGIAVTLAGAPAAAPPPRKAR